MQGAMQVPRSQWCVCVQPSAHPVLLATLLLLAVRHQLTEPAAPHIRVELALRHPDVAAAQAVSRTLVGSATAYVLPRRYGRGFPDKVDNTRCWCTKVVLPWHSSVP